MKDSFIVEVSTTIKRLTYLFSLGINVTDKSKIHEIWYFSVITEILIHLKDLTQKLKSLDNGIHFTDDIPKTNDYSEITSLVSHFRNAACHNDSQRRRNSQGYLFASNVFAAYDYPDDITILMGDAKIFVNRHMLRLYKEILQKLIAYKTFDKNEKFIEAIELAKYLGLI